MGSGFPECRARPMSAGHGRTDLLNLRNGQRLWQSRDRINIPNDARVRLAGRR